MAFRKKNSLFNQLLKYDFDGIGFGAVNSINFIAVILETSFLLLKIMEKK